MKKSKYIRPVVAVCNVETSQMMAASKALHRFDGTTSPTSGAIDLELVNWRKVDREARLSLFSLYRLHKAAPAPSQQRHHIKRKIYDAIFLSKIRRMNHISH